MWSFHPPSAQLNVVNLASILDCGVFFVQNYTSSYTKALLPVIFVDNESLRQVQNTITRNDAKGYGLSESLPYFIKTGAISPNTSIQAIPGSVKSKLI